ncbi:MAG: hypothetical protein DRZ90_14105 [Spirochaetes bacterium]|nr:MAG: hypothetical protein DRZ90_14105 [Spirochaetota bacterium]
MPDMIGLQALARDSGLSAYDAEYLKLAIQEGLPLATADNQLRGACMDCGVAVFPKRQFGLLKYSQTVAIFIIGSYYDNFSISRAKNELTQIIHAVETGPPVELTRHGKAAAVLLSVSDYDALTLKQKVYLRVTDLKFPAGKLIYEPEVSS